MLQPIRRSDPTPDINVLVVDDIEKNLLAMEALLSRPGMRILKAASGDEALEMLLVEEVALILVDVQMPGMSGYEFAELVRGNPHTRAIPLIFMTAAVGEQQRSFRGYQAGAVDFLQKPVDGDVLRSKVGVFAELFAQKKQLSMQLEELRQALKVNEMFTAVLGHDLRNPLAAVMNGSELLLRISEDPKVNAVATRIRSSSRRMEKMVSQLLDVARIRSGKLELDTRDGNYELVAQRIAEELRAGGQPGRVVITLEGSAEGRFDTDRIGQVFSNLLANALQHGELDAPVRLDIDGSDPEEIRITISNRGVIPAAMLPQIFTPFRSGGDKGSPGGLGLGLYIVKNFVDAHGGVIAVRSDELEGTVFCIRMPRKAA
ncbi:HAMP domain-containing histidine kinase [Noviherbaspirillum sp. DKR-6]|uniref:histidine kinase n=2 Tax=Noviherbaspirillum pedocola TaxID=2801341 RepID=A0A934SV07_9BURK|nr:HAMP domain-containing histidine kinase [Noviherbaspirillum pedocola]